MSIIYYFFKIYFLFNVVNLLIIYYYSLILYFFENRNINYNIIYRVFKTMTILFVVCKGLIKHIHNIFILFNIYFIICINNAQKLHFK